VRDQRDKVVLELVGLAVQGLALQLPRHDACEHAHEADLALAHVRVGRVGQAAQRAVQVAVGELHRHAHVGAHALDAAELVLDRQRVALVHLDRVEVSRERAQHLRAVGVLGEVGDLHLQSLACGLQGALDGLRRIGGWGPGQRLATVATLGERLANAK